MASSQDRRDFHGRLIYCRTHESSHRVLIAIAKGILYGRSVVMKRAKSLLCHPVLLTAVRNFIALNLLVFGHQAQNFD